MSFLSKATLAVVAGATALTAAAPAEAQRWHRHRNNDGAVIAAGVAGLAIGALAASAGRDRYYNRGYYYDRGYYGPRYRGYAPRYRGYYAPPPPRFRGYNDRWDRRAYRRAYRDRYYGW